MQATEWDQRYAEKRQWSAEPNALVAELLSDLAPGTAVDLAAGEGRHALWLAERGWHVTAVDFSDVGLDRGRSQPGGEAVTWVRADVRSWGTDPGSLDPGSLDPGSLDPGSLDPGSLDLVLVAYLHLAPDESAALLDRAVSWLRPGGRMLVLGHDVANIERGVGGPQEPSILHSVDRLTPVAARLDVDRLAQVPRETPAGTALDTLLWGRRPA